MSDCGCSLEQDQYYVQEARVGKKAPLFTMEALMPDGSFGTVSLQDYIDAGKWTLLYFYPTDFTFVCPTEIKEMSEALPRFQKLQTEVVSVSTDSVYAHLAWTKDASLGPIAHPMAADRNHAVSEAYGVLVEDKGYALRGLFLIDAKGILVHVCINDDRVGRNVEEALRLLEAFQTGGLAPCGWKPGQDLIEKK